MNHLADSTTDVRTLPSTPKVQLRKPLSSSQVLVTRGVTVALLAALWEITARAVDSLLLPTFIETLQALWNMVFITGDAWDALLTSNVALVVGYPIAVIIGVPIGLAMAQWIPVDKFFNPIVSISLSLPIAPLIPIVLVAMGLGLGPRVFIIVLFSWVYIATNVRAGVRAVDKSLIDMARSFQASESQLWRKVLTPAAFPAVLTGLRIGLGRAFAGMIIAELIMLPIGIGSKMLDYRGFFESANLYAITILVVFEGILLALIMQIFERRSQRWM